MAISRFQMNRQLRAYGGIMGQDGRRNYGIGSFFQKKIMDPIKNVFKNPVALATTAALAADQFGIPGTDIGGNKRVTGPIADILFGKKQNVILNPSEVEQGAEVIRDTSRSGGIFGGIKRIGTGISDVLATPVGSKDEKDKQSTIGSTLLSGILSPQALAIGSGLLAGAFTKDEDDPAFTGQDVGLNLRDIRKLANITDPKTGQAIGLSFLPDVEARKFTPAEMAASFAAADPVDFTEDRTPAQDGGIMGNQKDFEEFLQDMQNRDKSMLQDRILKDFEEFMKRKRMIDQMPEAKDGGLMKMAEGGMMNMGGMEMDLRGGGFVPMGKAEKADDVPARLSKNEFVFTADAVRAAGGGNIDKGADKMYATMKALENKVA
jgi:hypothetical protein